MSFNIGDKVRATQHLDRGSVPAGTLGVVAESAGDGCARVDFGSHVDWWYGAEDLELVEEVTEEPFVDRDLRDNPWQDYVKYEGYCGREAQLHYHIDLGLGSEESRSRAKELLAELYPEDPFAREGVIYRRRSGVLGGMIFRLVGDSVQSYDTARAKPIWEPAPGWEDGFREGDFTEGNFEIVDAQPEDTRSSTQPDGRSEMNRKMDTVREAGERRRQKLITHTHKLEAVIRDRNAEIETLRAALSKVAQVASDEAYKNIPMHTYPF